MKNYLLLMVVMLMSCKNQKEMKNIQTEIGSLMYSYEDSSVPPQHHRSYSLLVSKSKIVVKVDSYGTVLTDTTVMINQQQFDSLIAVYQNLNITLVKSREPQGCVGGTGSSLRVWDIRDSLILDGHVYYCGGKEYGNLQGDVRGLGQEIKELIPEFDQLLKRDWRPGGTDE